ncbi:FAD-dependent monooxygenase [Streptomyces sp. ZYX-F-203]
MDPVIVTGAGPVGLTLALALARQEVPCLLLDEGSGRDEPRAARTVVLRADTVSLMERLTGLPLSDAGTDWVGWRAMRRGRVVREEHFEPGPRPLHVGQHLLTDALRTALTREPLVRVVVNARLDGVERDCSGVTARTRGTADDRWRGAFLVGCDGPRSTVRKLLDIRFPGRTAVERHAVAALRTDLPWAGRAVMHRNPPWPTSGPSVSEITACPLSEGVWRLDWLLPPGRDLVTPEFMVHRVREALTGWDAGKSPCYELLDTGVHVVHHRLARRWRDGRVFLAGDAAHLLGALGTHGLDEGLRDADNLAWKLAACWHDGPREALLDSYQEERRAAVAARLRAADQVLPLLRGGGGLRLRVPGPSRDALLLDGRLGRGALGAPVSYADSPLAPRRPEGGARVDTRPGETAEDVEVTAEDGNRVRLRERLGRGALLVVLVAPGTSVWDRRHWVGAGVMPRLAAAVTALPYRAELLVADGYPGAAPHTVLLVRPDGYLVTAFGGVRPADLYGAAEAALGGSEAARAAVGAC